MKRHWVVWLIALLGFAPVVLNGADSTVTVLVSRIPFEFTVGDQAYPAGEYRVRFNISQNLNLVALGNEPGSEIQLFPTTYALPVAGTPSFVFRLYRYRDQSGAEQQAYFLSTINAGFGLRGRELFKSRSQKSVAREAALRPAASASVKGRPGRPELVAVAASR